MSDGAPAHASMGRTLLVTLVIGQAVALLACGFLATLRVATAPDERLASGAVLPMAPSAPRVDSTTWPASETVDPAAARSRTLHPDHHDEILGLLIYGIVSDARGVPVVGADVEVQRIDTTTAATGHQHDAEGYAITQLERGTYTVTANASGHLPATTSIALDGTAPGVRCDLQLQTAAQVVVYARFDDGEPFALDPEALGILAETFRANRLDWHVLPHLSTRPFGTRNVSLHADRQENVGCSKEYSEDPTALGVLEVQRELPLHAALCFGSEVLATALLPAGADRLDFTVPRDRLAGLHAQLIATVRDGRTGEPLEGARLSSAIGKHSTDAAGRAAVECLPPGRSQIQVAAEGFAPWFRWIDLPPGRTELDVTLHRAIRVHGRVVDALGEPLPASSIRGGWIHALDLSVMESPPATWIDSATSTGLRKDGGFELELPPGPHLLRLGSRDGWTGQAVVDPAQRGEEPIEILANPGVELRPQVEGEGFRALIVRDSSGDPISWSHGERTFQLRVRVTPGTYTLEIHDATHLVESRPLEVPAGIRALPVEIR